MARNTATASLERQTIYFSKRRWGVGGGEGCNIDTVFIELMIAKYHPALQLRVRDGGVRNSFSDSFHWEENSYGKFSPL